MFMGFVMYGGWGVNREIHPSIPCDSGEDADCRNIHTDGSSYLGQDLSDDDKSGF